MEITLFRMVLFKDNDLGGFEKTQCTLFVNKRYTILKDVSLHFASLLITSLCIIGNQSHKMLHYAALRY